MLTTIFSYKEYINRNVHIIIGQQFITIYTFINTKCINKMVSGVHNYLAIKILVRSCNTCFPNMYVEQNHMNRIVFGLHYNDTIVSYMIMPDLTKL